MLSIDLRRWSRQGLVAVICGALAGCAAGTNDTPAPTPGPTAVSDLFRTFAPPSQYLLQLQRQASLYDGPRYKTGDAVSYSLPLHNVTLGGGLAHFTPSYTPGATLGQAAYCGYRFDLTGLSGSFDLAYSWETPPEEDDLAYIGAANFARDIWEWQAAPAIGLLNLPATAPYITPPGNTMLVMVVCLGTETVELANIRLGNTAPVAAFTMDTSSGVPGRVVHFDGTGSSDADGNIAKYRWDPEGDGSYQFNPLHQSGSPTLTFTYSRPGTYQPRLKVTDDSGATAEFSRSLLITLGHLYSGTIDNSPEIESQCAAALVDGKPAVAYLSGERLCYQYALSVEAMNWSGAVQVDILGGASLDLAVIAGRPAIAYQSYQEDLAYVRANNAGGTSWPAPQIAAVKAGLWIGYDATLAEICSRPGIIYGARGMGNPTGQIWYTHSAEANGTDWSAPLQLNLGGITGRKPALGFIYGVPMAAVEAWPTGTSKTIHSLRALDPFGSSWNISYAAVATGTAWNSQESLLNLSDKAGYGFWDGTDSKLKFARAKQVEALEFYAPVQITGATNVQSAFAFRVINGLPCCAYGDAIGGLCYVIARNSTGTSWNAPLIIDAQSDVGKVSLIEVQSLPAFAYCDTTTGDLDFAIYR